MSSRIFRFLSFESFVDLVLREQLAFVTYDMWQDPYEGFVIKAMQTDKGRADIIRWFKENNLSSEMPPDVRLSILENYSKTVHLQSWTKCEETDALWRIYAFNGNSIRIETTIKNLQRINNINFFPVEYKSMSLERELKSIFAGNKIQIHKAFSWKRKAFSHEEEFRLISNIDHEYLPEQQSHHQSQITPDVMLRALQVFLEKGDITQQEYESGVANVSSPSKTNIKQVRYISFSHIPNFVKSVMVHPTASDWFAETVGHFCKNYHINFLGKSNLYRFNHR